MWICFVRVDDVAKLAVRRPGFVAMAQFGDEFRINDFGKTVDIACLEWVIHGFVIFRIYKRRSRPPPLGRSISDRCFCYLGTESATSAGYKPDCHGMNVARCAMTVCKLEVYTSCICL